MRLFFVASILLTSTPANAETIAGRATVIDGNTLEIRGERIRILRCRFRRARNDR
jgi:endonuclease YncB( thermonuclease family)